MALDRNELGAFLVQAGVGSARDHALASLLALNGLRISEALGADVDDLDFERGHRTLKIVRQGGRPVTIPLAPRTSRALDLFLDERTGDRSSWAPKATGWIATPPTKPSSVWAGGAGIASGLALTASGIPLSQPPDAGVALRDAHEAASHTDPRTTMRYDRGRGPSIATLPTSSQRSLRAPFDESRRGQRYRAPVTLAPAGYRSITDAPVTLEDRQSERALDDQETSD